MYAELSNEAIAYVVDTIAAYFDDAVLETAPVPQLMNV
jgi:hypothetical protein